MPDTDYDSLPSPPRARARPAGATGRGKGRTYGRKAVRVAGQASAHRAARDGQGEQEGGSESSESGEEERGARVVRAGGSKRARGKGRAGKARGAGREDEGDVESNDNGEREAVREELAPLFKGKKHRSPEKRTATSAATASGLKQSHAAPLTKATHGTLPLPGFDANAPQPAKRSAAAGRRERSFAARPASASHDSDGDVDIKQHDELRRAPALTTTRTAAVAKKLAGAERLFPAIDNSAGDAPLSPRTTALGDKSNLTVDSPRRTHSRSRPSQIAPAGNSPRPSTSRQSNPASAALGVFRDGPAVPSPARRTSLAHAVPHPGSSASTSRLRAPRAATALRLASEPPPSRPAPAQRALSRSPSIERPAAPRRSLSLHTSPRAPQRTSPARLAVPGSASARDSLAPASVAVPAPWALAVPASPGRERSSSPFAVAAGGDAPAFRYTTTEFGDLPSLRLSLDAHTAPGGGAQGGGEDDAAGMESSIVLETWEDELSRVGGLRVEDAVEEEGDDGEQTLRPVRIRAGETGFDEAHMQVDEAMPRDVGAPDATDVAREPLVHVDGSDEDGDATIKAASPALAEVEPAALDSDHAAALTNDVPGEQVLEDGLVAGASTPIKTSPAASPSRPGFFTASFLPPRRMRPSVDAPLPDGPPDDEDDLAYYLRTTGTFSSEDDLPSSAPSDASELEDYLAEREVGRGVKPSSRQREKRVAASAEADRLRLRAGRRDGLQREVLDVDQVKLPRAVRAAIAARAERVPLEEQGEAASDHGRVDGVLRDLLFLPSLAETLTDRRVESHPLSRPATPRMLASADDILHGGDGVAAGPVVSGGSDDTSPKWIFPVVAVAVLLVVGVGAAAFYGVWRIQRGRAFQRLGGDADDAERAEDPGCTPTAYPPSTFVFVEQSTSRSGASQELRLLPSIPYSGAAEPASPSYSPVVPQGHSSIAGRTSPTSADVLRLPDQPSATVQRTPSRRRGAPGLTLEPQSLVSSLAAEEHERDGALGLPGRAPSLPPPPYSPQVVGVGVCLSPRRAEAP